MSTGWQHGLLSYYVCHLSHVSRTIFIRQTQRWKPITIFLWAPTVCKESQLWNLTPKLWLVVIPSILDLLSNSRVKALVNGMYFDLIVRNLPLNTAILCWAQWLFPILNLSHSQNFLATLWPACCRRNPPGLKHSPVPPMHAHGLYSSSLCASWEESSSCSWG